MTRPQLRALGVSERRIEGAEVVTVLPRRYASAAEPPTLDMIAGYALRHLVPGAAAAYVTGAQILGIPLPARLEYSPGDPVHVALGGRAGRSSSRHLAIHERQPFPTVRVRGLAVTHPTHVLCSLVPDLDREELIAACDSLLWARGRRTWFSRETLLWEAEGISVRGVQAVRAALRETRDGVESPQETRTRTLLRRAGYPEPLCNPPFEDPDTGRIFYLDLAYPQARIAIEYDGEQHLVDPEQRLRDHAKDGALHRAGWAVLRATRQDLREPGDLLARLAALWAERSA